MTISAHLLERDAELIRTCAALDRARDGQGGAVVAWGQAGIGKTSLLTATREAAERRGMRVLSARAGQLEREFGFGVVRQLFEPLLAAATPAERTDWLEGAAGRAARLLDLPGGRDVPPVDAPSSDRSFLVLHGLYWLCVQLAASGPVCLVVDDAHWADSASLRFLAFLLPRLHESPVALLLAARAGEGAAGSLLTGLMDDAVTEVLEMTPLSCLAVQRMLTAGLGEDPGPALVRRCHEATGGVPLLVEQLVRRLKEEGLAPGGVEAQLVEALGGRAVERWVLVRIRALGEQAVALARAVAVLETGPLRVAADLAGLDLAAAVTAGDALARAGVLAAGRPLRFVHPVVRRAVYDELGATRRGAVHRMAAELLAASGADPQTSAEHLLVAEPVADPRVADQLHAAATQATARGAVDSAAAYLTRALLEPPAPEAIPDIQLDLGLAQFTQGNPEAFGHLERGVQTARTEAETATAAAALAFVFQMAGRRIAHTVRVLDDAAVALRDPALRQLVETTAVGIAAMDLEVTATHRDQMAAARRRTDDPSAPQSVLALGGLLAMLTNAPSTEAAALALRALHAEPEPLPDRWSLPRPALLQIICTLVFTERDDEALPLVDRLLREARTSPSVVSAAAAHRAIVALQRGDLRGAEADARSTLDTPGRGRSRPVPGVQPRYHRAGAHRAGVSRPGRGPARPDRGRGGRQPLPRSGDLPHPRPVAPGAAPARGGAGRRVGRRRPGHPCRVAGPRLAAVAFTSGGRVPDARRSGPGACAGGRGARAGPRLRRPPHPG